MQHRRTTAASMFQNGISRNTKCDIMVGFPKSSHILYSYMYILLEINKNLKFKRGVGIAINSKETSSKLAIVSS